MKMAMDAELVVRHWFCCARRLAISAVRISWAPNADGREDTSRISPKTNATNVENSRSSWELSDLRKSRPCFFVSFPAGFDGKLESFLNAFLVSKDEISWQIHVLELQRERLL